MSQIKRNTVRSEGTRSEYAARVNRALDYIEAHLAEELDLDTLARVASFSPYHFHRIFGAMVGEPLNRYIRRVRLERAAGMLVYNPSRSITEIALDCGFSSSATFARAFSAAFGQSASLYRKIGQPERKNGKTKRKGGKEPVASVRYLGLVGTNQAWRIEMTQMTTDVEVTSLSARSVAYVRHIGPYAGKAEVFEGLIGRLVQWAGPRGLLGLPDAQLLSVYHDDPEITDEDKLRLEFCLTVPEDTEAEGEVGRMEIPGGPYAVAHFELDVDQYGDAWQAVMGDWLPDSGYQPDDRPCLEIYRNDPNQHPEGKQIVDICIPVKPL